MQLVDDQMESHSKLMKNEYVVHHVMSRRAFCIHQRGLIEPMRKFDDRGVDREAKLMFFFIDCHATLCATTEVTHAYKFRPR